MAKMKRIFCCFFLILPLVAFVGGDMEAAFAQEKRSLLEKLFGRKKAPETASPQIDRKRPASRQRARQPSSKRRTSPSPGQQARRETAKSPVEKSPDAKRILVIGDFVAAALADGLAQNYSDNPDFEVIKQVDVASGLVRDDYYNWPVKAAEFIKEQKPDVVLVALGGNDRQAFRLGGSDGVAYGEAAWEQHYQTRIDLLAEQLQAAGQSWGWVGLPSFKQSALNQTVAAFNSLYKARVERGGGHFVDIWDGFVDGNGNFSFSGYDVNGQTVRLRNNDGINFTPAGRRKLAFYADGAVRELLKNSAEAVAEETAPLALPPDAGQIGQGGEEQPDEAVSVRLVERVAPKGLWEIEGGATTLAGAAPSAGTAQPSGGQQHKFQPQAGRADYFSLAE